VTTTSNLDIFLAEPRNVIVAGIRKDGRPHLTPNWFFWDGDRFYVSTTRNRVKYKIFRRDPRVELNIDDVTGFRTVLVSGTVEIREDVHSELDRFRAISTKHGRPATSDEELTAGLIADDRVLLSITPTGTPDTWTTWGLE
jgi:PPOX class probable F420-dependent enzyme